jgi:hypothetical protein
MYEIRVRRGIRRLKGEQVTGKYKKFCNEKILNLLSLSEINRMTQSRRLRWAGHVTLMRQERNAYKVLVGS